MYRQTALPDGLVFAKFNGTVSAIHIATATERWKYAPSSWELGASMLLLCAGSRLFVITSRIEALNQETGEPIWDIAAPLPRVEEAVGTHDYLLLAGSGQICAVRASDGSLLWTARGNLAGVSLPGEAVHRARSNG